MFLQIRPCRSSYKLLPRRTLGEFQIEVLCKGPSYKPDVVPRTGFNLFGLRLELINIPIRPEEFAVQEPGFRARKPNMEACRQGH
jgi:hypothetical protein